MQIKPFFVTYFCKVINMAVTSECFILMNNIANDESHLCIKITGKSLSLTQFKILYSLYCVSENFILFHILWLLWYIHKILIIWPISLHLVNGSVGKYPIYRCLFVVYQRLLFRRKLKSVNRKTEANKKNITCFDVCYSWKNKRSI